MSLKSRLSALTVPVETECMYSVQGARFQEWALQHVTSDNKRELVSSGFIGELVTDINNDRLTVEQATQRFNNALYAQFR